MKDGNQAPHTIAKYSRKLKSSESKCQSIGLETIYSRWEFNPYFCGRKFLVYTVFMFPHVKHSHLEWQGMHMNCYSISITPAAPWNSIHCGHWSQNFRDGKDMFVLGDLLTWDSVLRDSVAAFFKVLTVHAFPRYL